MECMFTAQGPSVLHAIEVTVVQFAQVHLVSYNVIGFNSPLALSSMAVVLSATDTTAAKIIRGFDKDISDDPMKQLYISHGEQLFYCKGACHASVTPFKSQSLHSLLGKTFNAVQRQ